MASALQFPRTHKLDGFSTDATARRDGSPDPVVRELLQNSLDAATEASRGTPQDPAEVVFTLSECRWSDIPGADAYRKAFRLAVEERERRQPDGLSVEEARVIRRIRSAVSEERVPLLFCRDNGIGIDNLERILFEGNTSKPRHGGGSVGVGHMTAFAASDLRYVLYASRTRVGDVAGGHTILAAHSEGKTRYAGDGYYTREHDLFEYDPDNTDMYHADVPPVFTQQISRIEDTGSVVCITGFNDFRSDQPVQEIFRVAAANFLAAIHEGCLIITITDKDKFTAQLSSENIHVYLERQKTQQRARGDVYFAGNRAFRAYETLNEGYLLDIEDANIRDCTKVWFRLLPPGDGGQSTQINLFRDGMWIATNPAGLGVAEFRGYQPFDCVVSLSSDRLTGSEEMENDTYHLVRSAEGPEHCGLEKLAEMSREERSEIRRQFRVIAERLQREAGEFDVAEYTPEGFAVIRSNTQMYEAEALPRYRPLREKGERVTITHDDGDDPNEEHGKRRRRSRSGTAPAAGRTVAVRSSIRIRPEQSDAMTIAWQPHEGEDARNLAIRVRMASGSDETCEQPLRPTYLRLASIEHEGNVTKAGSDPLELPLPAPAGIATIRFEGSVSSGSVELDIVRRRRASIEE